MRCLDLVCHGVCAAHQRTPCDAWNSGCLGWRRRRAREHHAMLGSGVPRSLCRTPENTMRCLEFRLPWLAPPPRQRTPCDAWIWCATESVPHTREHHAMLGIPVALAGAAAAPENTMRCLDLVCHGVCAAHQRTPCD